MIGCQASLYSSDLPSILLEIFPCTKITHLKNALLQTDYLSALTVLMAG